jgi:hypothetical protein
MRYWKTNYNIKRKHGKGFRDSIKLVFKIGGSKLQKIENRGTKTAFKPSFFILTKKKIFG